MERGSRSQCWRGGGMMIVRGQCPPCGEQGPALIEAVLWAVREEEPWEHLCMSEEIKGR